MATAKTIETEDKYALALHVHKRSNLCCFVEEVWVWMDGPKKNSEIRI